MNRAVIVWVASVLAACAGASSTSGGAPAAAPAPVAAPVPPPPPPPPPIPVPPARDTVSAVNPEGNYELQIAFGGSPVSLAMELYRENGAWHGTVGNPGLGSATVTGLVQEGRKFRVTLVAQTGDPVTFNFELKADDSVTGTWSGFGDGSPVTGKKVR